MFAVFKTGGKQYRVAADDRISVARVKGEPGELVEFGEVLLVGGDNMTLGSPTVAGATVAGEVIAHGRDRKVIAFKKRRRQNSRRKRGHRQEFSLIRITEILTDGRKPTPRPKAEAATRPEQGAAAGEADRSTGEEAETRAKHKASAKTKKPAKTKAPASGGKTARSSAGKKK
jgi:large subunit ribosomal protein L21